jgi:bis(5'-nucleosyl)-tetraphosphatase (symmetrical)
MSLYCIGDLQGCDAPFARLLDKIAFSPSRDTLFLVGDLVNRGPESLGALRRVRSLGNAAHSLLGNHDLHLLAVAAGVRKAHRKDTLQSILGAPDRDELLDWLRHCPLAIEAHGWLMVHAGVLPTWSVPEVLALAAEVEIALRQPDYAAFLTVMYGDTPNRWHDGLQGTDRLRVIVNALTRMRFCTADGAMEFETKQGADAAPAGFMPWFDVPRRATTNTPIAFGHWSALVSDKVAQQRDFDGMRNHTLPLDTGCVWGNKLTVARLRETPGEFELISENCNEQANAAA